MVDVFGVSLTELRFTIPEILSLIGITQCVYVMVYIGLRARRISRAGLPVLYFSVLGSAFFLDFAQNYLGSYINNYEIWQWFAWFYGPPLSVLLIIQIGQVTRLPALHHYWVLALIPLAFFAARLLSQQTEDFQGTLIISGLIAGAVSLLTIWLNRTLFTDVHKQKAGKERYWLILALIFMNIGFLSYMLVSLNMGESQLSLAPIRTLLGLGFIYLVSTSLFRIYPQALLVEKRSDDRLSDFEFDVARKVESLMNLEQVYQEPSYSRTDMARECDVSETVLSRIINSYFGKSLPQLMNEYRVEDAKRLLRQTQAPVKAIGEDVGFNSLASFNRVFKDISGASPSKFRKENS